MQRKRAKNFPPDQYMCRRVDKVGGGENRIRPPLHRNTNLVIVEPNGGDVSTNFTSQQYHAHYNVTLQHNNVMSRYRSSFPSGVDAQQFIRQTGNSLSMMSPAVHRQATEDAWGVLDYRRSPLRVS